MLSINKRPALTIHPADTTWYKVITDGSTLVYGIHVLGSLKLNSVKLTSWNPQTNYYATRKGLRERSGLASRDCEVTVLIP
jgi:hypothetical protein